MFSLGCGKSSCTTMRLIDRDTLYGRTAFGEIMHLAHSGIAFSPPNEGQERTLEGRVDS